MRRRAAEGQAEAQAHAAEGVSAAARAREEARAEAEARAQLAAERSTMSREELVAEVQASLAEERAEMVAALESSTASRAAALAAAMAALDAALAEERARHDAERAAAQAEQQAAHAAAVQRLRDEVAAQKATAQAATEAEIASLRSVSTAQQAVVTQDAERQAAATLAQGEQTASALLVGVGAEERALAERRAADTRATAATAAASLRAAAQQRCAALREQAAADEAALRGKLAGSLSEIDQVASGQLRALGGMTQQVSLAFAQRWVAVEQRFVAARAEASAQVDADLAAQRAEAEAGLLALSAREQQLLVTLATADEAAFAAAREAVVTALADAEARADAAQERWTQEAERAEAVAMRWADGALAAIAEETAAEDAKLRSQLDAQQQAAQAQVDRTLGSIREMAEAKVSEVQAAAEQARVAQGDGARAGLVDTMAIGDAAGAVLSIGTQRAILGAEGEAARLGLRDVRVEVGHVVEEGGGTLPAIMLSGTDEESGLSATLRSSASGARGSFEGVHSTEEGTFQGNVRWGAGGYDVAMMAGSRQETDDGGLATSGMAVGAHFGRGEGLEQVRWAWQTSETAADGSASSRSSNVHVSLSDERKGAFGSTYGVNTDGERSGVEGGFALTDDGFQARAGGYVQGQGGVVGVRHGEQGTSAELAAGFDDVSVALGGMWGENGWGIQGGVDVGKFGVEAGYRRIEDRFVSDVIGNRAQGQDAVIRQMFDGAPVAAFGFMDQSAANFGVHGQVQVVELGLSASSETLSSARALQVVPEHLRDDPKKVDAWMDSQGRAAVEGVNALHDIDPLALRDGQGWAFSDAASNAVEGTLGAYGIGVSLGVDGREAHEVTMMRSGTSVLVDVMALQGQGSSMGLSAAGALSLQGHLDESESDRVRFSVDVQSEEGRASLEQFTQLGLLPGALDASGDEELAKSVRAWESLRASGASEQQIATAAAGIRADAAGANATFLKHQEALPASPEGVTYQGRQEQSQSTAVGSAGLLGLELFRSFRQETWTDLHYRENGSEESGFGWSLQTEKDGWWIFGDDEAAQQTNVWANPRSSGAGAPLELAMGASVNHSEDTLLRLGALSAAGLATNDPMLRGILDGSVDHDALGDVTAHVAVGLTGAHLDAIEAHMRQGVLSDPGYWMGEQARADAFSLTDNNAYMFSSMGMYGLDPRFYDDEAEKLNHLFRMVDGASTQAYLDREVQDAFFATAADDMGLDASRLTEAQRASVQRKVDEQLDLVACVSDVTGQYFNKEDISGDHQREAQELYLKRAEIQAAALKEASAQLAAVEDERDYAALDPELRELYAASWVQQRVDAGGDPWDALGLAFAVTDPVERNESVRYVFSRIEKEDDGHDAVLQFAEFLEGVAADADDPIVAEAMRSAISFELEVEADKDSRVAGELMAYAADEMGLVCRVPPSGDLQQLLGALGRFGQDPVEAAKRVAAGTLDPFRPGERASSSDANEAVRLLRAAQATGSVSSTLELANAGADADDQVSVDALLDGLRGHDAQRQAVADILRASGYRDEVEASLNAPSWWDRVWGSVLASASSGAAS